MTAQYEPISTYLVTFQLVDQLSLVSGDLVQEIPEGSAAIAPQVVADPGYQFVGWDVAFDTVTSDLQVTAQVEAVTDNAIRLHQGVINNVNDNWQTVNLPYIYNSMVVVCTVNLPSASSPSAVPRVRNASGNSFQVKVQTTGNISLVADYSVHYLVVEEGRYTLANNGVQMEAVKFDSSITDSSSSWIGESRSYLNGYSNPVVLGQVMTTNDNDWSVFWAQGNTIINSTLSTALKVGKHVGEDTRTSRANETVGYVVIESGSGTIGGFSYEAGLGADIVRGVQDSPPYNYKVPVLASDTVILSAAAMDGANGGWPVLYGTSPLENGQISLAFDEDQQRDLERSHTDEQVAYLVLRGNEIELNSSPEVVSSIADITIDENSPDRVLSLYPVFQDAETADENLLFEASSSNESLVTTTVDALSGNLNLIFVAGASGTATIKITAIDDDAENPLSISESFVVTVVPVHTVTFDLGAFGTRIGGGALVQTISNGRAALVPEIIVTAGWVFDRWDNTFDNVTADLIVNALYTPALSDNDLLPDDWEIAQFGNLNQTESGDPDGDNFNNMDEYRLATNPQVFDLDTDSDDIPDEIENLYATLDPNLSDALADGDGDGIYNIFEIYNGSDPDKSESVPTFGQETIAYFKVDSSLSVASDNNFVTINDAAAVAQNYNYAIVEALSGNYGKVSLVSSLMLVAPQGPEQTTIISLNSSEEALVTSDLCVVDGFTLNNSQKGPIFKLNSQEEVIIKNCWIAPDEANLKLTSGAGVFASGRTIRFLQCYMPE